LNHPSPLARPRFKRWSGIPPYNIYYKLYRHIIPPINCFVNMLI